MVDLQFIFKRLRVASHRLLILFPLWSVCVMWSVLFPPADCPPPLHCRACSCTDTTGPRCTAYVLLFFSPSMKMSCSACCAMCFWHVLTTIGSFFRGPVWILSPPACYQVQGHWFVLILKYILVKTQHTAQIYCRQPVVTKFTHWTFITFSTAT